MVAWMSRRRLALAPALALSLLCGLTAVVASQQPAAALDKPVEWVGTIKVKEWQANTEASSSSEYWHETTYTLAPDAAFTNEATWSGAVHYSVKSYATDPCPGLQDWTFYDDTSSGAGVEMDVTYSAPQGGYSLATEITFVPIDVVHRRIDTCTGESTNGITAMSAPGPTANGPILADENAMTLTGELNEGTAALGHSTHWNLRRVNCDKELDTDGGGVGDCLEVDQRTDPNNPDDDYEADFDQDGVFDVTDNCWTVANPDQSDADKDGVGDACEIPDSCDDVGITHRYFSTADGTASLAAALAPDPDFATFGIALSWCRSPYGSLVDSGWVTQSDLSSNWVFLGVLENFGFEPYQRPPTVKIGANSVTGAGTFGVKASLVGVVSSLAPTGKLLNKVAKELARFKEWRKLGMTHDKAMDKLEDLIRRHIRGWVDSMDARVFESLSKIPGVSKGTALAWTALISKVFTDVGEDLHRRVVKKLIGGKTMVKKAFKLAFGTAKLALWKPRVTLTVTGGNQAAFTNDSRVWGLKDEWVGGTTG